MYGNRRTSSAGTAVSYIEKQKEKSGPDDSKYDIGANVGRALVVDGRCFSCIRVLHRSAAVVTDAAAAMQQRHL